jgi:hypothetical protein
MRIDNLPFVEKTTKDRRTAKRINQIIGAGRQRVSLRHFAAAVSLMGAASEIHSKDLYENQ